jgi:hypothetical protein
VSKRSSASRRIQLLVLPVALLLAPAHLRAQHVARARVAPVALSPTLSPLAVLGDTTAARADSVHRGGRRRGAAKGALIGAVAGAAVAAISNAQTSGRPSYNIPHSPFDAFLVLVPVGAAVGAVIGFITTPPS